MIEYKMMDGSNILGRCLHGGTIAISNIKSNPTINNYLSKICNLYGSSAVLAFDGDNIVGLLRFYPEEIFEIMNNQVCVHDKATEKNLIRNPSFPDFDNLKFKTLKVECVQVVTYYHKGQGKDYGRKGIGKSMFEKLIEWAKANGWHKIKYKAINPYTPLLLWTGSYSVEKLKGIGFKVTNEEESEELRDGIKSQIQGHHGTEIKEMWAEYKELDLNEASTLFSVELDL